MASLLLVTLSLIASQDPAATQRPAIAAPSGAPQTKYCLRVDPLPGSRIQTIQCRTRDEWALLQIDVDQEWSENGVKTIA